MVSAKFSVLSKRNIFLEFEEVGISKEHAPNLKEQQQNAFIH